MADNNSNCFEPVDTFNTSLGFIISVPEWEAALTVFILSFIIILTIVGNILVILSVFTHKPLRIVQNFFIVSLAVADLTVAILVMPFNVAYSIIGRWLFDIHVCKMWLTSDVMCCTASILNLCAIALDRFWAITDPINYAQKRTLKRVLLMIGGVWVLSLIISSPPLIGWNDWPDKFEDDTPCQLTERQGYVVYSSLGSFFIPLFIMTIVYVEIFIATKRRLRERARATKLNTIASKHHQSSMQSARNSVTRNPDQESVSSETNHNEVDNAPNGNANDQKKQNKKHKKKKKHNKENGKKDEETKYLRPLQVQEDSVTDNPENSSESHRRNSLIQCTSDSAPHTSSNTSETPVVLNSPRNNVVAQKEVVLVVPPAVKKSGAVYQFIEEKQRISLSKERRAARTLGIIMGVFVVCWLPFFLMYVIKPFCPDCCPSRKLINFITWLGYINSALNPIIYTIFNLDFRRAFKKLLGIKV